MTLIIHIPDDYSGMDDCKCPKCKSLLTFGKTENGKKIKVICANCGHQWEK